MTDIELDQRLTRMEQMLAVLMEHQTIQDWYDVAEFGRLVGKAEFTRREWARLGRINAEKRKSGRGASASWVISHQELLRNRR
jgi:hypothetical protein